MAVDKNEELAYFAYEWLRSNARGKKYSAHDGMREVTLDGCYDLIALFAAIRVHCKDLAD